MLAQIFIEFIVAGIAILVCISVQTVANIGLLYWVLGTFERAERKFGLVWRVSLVVRIIFAFIGIHLSQISIWFLCYLLLGCFSSADDALYFSLSMFSTSDTGGVALPREWRLLGSFEGLAGIIGFGLSIGFMFAVISRLQESRIRRRQEYRSDGGTRPSN